MTAPTLQADISTLSSLSVKQPDYFFVHGFITGIACCPDALPNSVWQPELFGELNFESEDQFSLMPGLVAFYNDIMTNAMDRRLKMPIECINFNFQLKGDQFTEQPLSQWCQGFLKSLELLDDSKLNDSQTTVLDDVEENATAYCSYEDLRSATAIAGDNWKMIVTQMRIDLEADLNLLLGVMRFGEELDFSEFDEMMNELEEDEDFDYEDADPFALMDSGDVPSQEEQDKQMEAIYRMAIYENSPEAHLIRERLISELELENGEGYFDGKDKDFWDVNRHNNYMVLRSRRAHVYFESNKKAEAIAELHALLKLSPHDKFGNRFALANMLITQKDWETLATLLSDYQENTVAMLSAKALMLYANDPTNLDAKAAKKQLIKHNKQVVKYLTGQKKVKYGVTPNASDAIREAETYVLDFGQDAWRSVEGAMGWLRKK